MEVHDAEEAIGMRKMLAHDIRMRKNPHKGGHFLTFYGFSWSYAGSECNLYFRMENTFPANISCFPRRLQDVFKTSSKKCLQDVLQLCLQDVFKTSWKTKKYYTEDVFKTSSRRLQYVLTKTNVCWVVLT